MNINLVYIISGFLLGQGSMFLVQTYLASSGYFELIANVGIGLGILSLIQWTTDGGGVFFLSIYEKENKLASNLSAFIQARMIVGFTFFVLILTPLYFFDLLNTEALNIVFYSPLVIVIWAFNLTGVADSRNDNKFLGPISGLSWLLSALCLFLFYKFENLSHILGVSFFIGLFITVCLQYIVLSIGISNVFKLVGVKLVFSKIKIILSYSFAYISSQSYARSIPIIISHSIDNNVAGMYVYAKNFTNSISQLIMFSRRVEFARLIEVVSVSFGVKDVLKTQSTSFSIAIFISACAFVFYLLTFYISKLYMYSQLFLFFFVMMSLQVFWVLSSSLEQVLLAKNKTKYYSIVTLFTCAFSLFFILFSATQIGVYSVFLSEFFMFVLQFVVYYLIIKKCK